MRKIFWSESAKSDFQFNIEYLLSEWSEKEALNFVKQTSIIIGHIEDMPFIYPESDYKNVRKAFVLKQITLFYRIRNNHVELLRFWNNYQNPESFREQL
ncbi:MAG: type II toxin-antitoxin system RelE/ParE family toxin [Chitinophagaceae bacterium]|nr:MAG: type II toxin-antitoxin system RelE/ParE family toxin [Chitinophagaceae bacterium]